MDCLLNLLGPVVQPCIGPLVNKVGRRIGYVSGYKKNMSELKTKKDELEKKIKENNKKVELAKTRNDVLDEDVVRWAEEAGELKRKVENLLITKAKDENVECATCCCSNLFSRCKTSKDGEKRKLEKKKVEKKMGKCKLDEQKVKEVNIQIDSVKEETSKEEEHEVKDLVDAKASDGNMKYPNLCSRYKMSKQAAQMKDDVEKYIQEGNFPIIAQLRQAPSDHQFTSSSKKFMDFDSRRKLLKKIKDGIVNPEVNVVGVYGAGGVGKTAAVEEVCKQLQKEGVFYEVVIAAVSRQVNIRKIQGVIADRLSPRLSFESETDEGRAGELYNRLNNGKDNLVILDDLWQKLDWKAIGISLEDGNKHCKVILTTRDLNVLKRMNVSERISFSALTKEEAWALFENNVRINLVPGELLTLAKFICQECGELPVAILAIAGALGITDDIGTWRTALKQLQNSSWEEVDGIDKKMYNSLKWSYNYLNRENRPQPTILQSILLLCCLYPEDANIRVDLLVFHCIARRLFERIDVKVKDARDQIYTLVNSLKAHSLLLDGKDETYVKMHDVIRDVVLSIARSDEKYLVEDGIDEWPAEFINQNLAAASIRFEKLKEVPNGLVCPRLHTMRLECMRSTPMRTFLFPYNFFSGVGDLRSLELRGINMRCTPISLANVPKLRTLILEDCIVENMSFLKGLNLEVLLINGSLIKSLPKELRASSHLQVLTLYGCNLLEEIPAGVISNLTYLEELHFPSKLTITKETLSEVSSLTRLTSLSIRIPNDVPIPENLFFDNLVSYQVVVGEYFTFEPFSKRKIIKLVNTSYNDVFAKLVERAESIHLRNIEGLKFLFTSSNRKGIQQLRELYIKDCEMLEQIIGTEGEIDNEYDIYNYPVLCFSKLKKLHLENLPKLGCFGPKVEKTTAEEVPLTKGQPLFTEKVIFLVLEKIYIRGLQNITEIWDKKVIPETSFPRPLDVYVIDCNNLENIFPSYSWSRSLKTVDITGCEGVTLIFPMIEKEEEIYFANNHQIIFPFLLSILLYRLENFECFCGDTNSFNQLYLFSPKVQFPALENIQLGELNKLNLGNFMEQVIYQEVIFPSLRKLDFDYEKYDIDWIIRAAREEWDRTAWEDQVSKPYRWEDEEEPDKSMAGKDEAEIDTSIITTIISQILPFKVYVLIWIIWCLCVYIGCSSLSGLMF